MAAKFKWSTLVGFVCAVTILGYALIGFSQAPQASVQLAIAPPVAQVVPLEAEATNYLGSGKYSSPVQLTLRAQDATGATLKNARFNLQILTPPPTPWFTTDFPMVEGTKLLAMTSDAPTGELQLQQVFPIRGNYQLQVQVTSVVDGAFAPITQTLNLTVPENPVKFRYFLVTLAVLLAIGIFGGWIIGGRQETLPGEIAPKRVRMLLSGVTVLAIAALLFFNISAELVKAHHSMETMQMGDATPKSDNSGLITSQGLKLELTGDAEAVVGQTASFQAKLTDTQTNQLVKDVVFAIVSTQLENKWVAFAYQGVPDAKGTLAWQEQFFDGAPHSVQVEVSPNPQSKRQFQPFQVQREIEVEGVAPPISVRLITLLYFTGVLALGVVAGLWFRGQRSQKQFGF